jgi:predicted Rossmann fold nucleotide-binding protein DprA/Smf involved in DNA uptake
MGREMANLKDINIVSGGQTGADRAALDWAINHGIPYGGWCPKGRRAEDGSIDAKYQLQETPSSNYLQRTEWNARDYDGTVIFSIAEHLTGGSLKTVEFAVKHRKPSFHLSAGNKANASSELNKWMQENTFWSRDNERGHIDGVVFEDIRASANPLRVELQGYDEAHAVEDVRFEDVVVNGKPLSAVEVKTNAFVKKVVYRP